MHNQGPMNIDKLAEQKMGIAKLVGLGDEYVGDALKMVERNITPIIRIWRPEFSGKPLDAELERQFRSYLQAGLKWFEFYNEPNLYVEWPPGANFDPLNIGGVIAPLIENWLTWAEMVISYGAYPGFISLSEAGGGWENTTTWINQLLLYLFDNHHNRFVDILANGFWLATHPYVLNHFYQEMPGGGPLSARPPEMQNAFEPGWHFEYPYDPISQASDPGRSVWGGTPLAPLGDVHGLIGSGLAFMERLQEMFGVGAVPVIGTEGGLWPLPDRNSVKQLDIRYPGFTWESHAHATVAMFDWISHSAPPWMFGVALWKWDHYYDASGGGPMPAEGLLQNSNFIPKQVPPIPAVGDYVLDFDEGPAPPVRVVIEIPGPGPVHGQPEFHFMVLAPGIDKEWFFDIARVYWDRFKPTLMTVYDFINFLPKSSSLAVTVITTPDMVDLMNKQIAVRWPNIYMDLIVANTPNEVEDLLNSRVAAGRRFG